MEEIRDIMSSMKISFGLVALFVLVTLLIILISGVTYYYLGEVSQSKDDTKNMQPVSKDATDYQDANESKDYIKYTFFSFGLEKSIYVTSDGTLRVIDEIAARQGKAPGCQTGKIAQREYMALSEFVIATDFMQATTDQKSDFGMCESGSHLKAKIGEAENTLSSICLQNLSSATQSTEKNNKIVSDVHDKLRRLVDSSQLRTCER